MAAINCENGTTDRNYHTRAAQWPRASPGFPTGVLLPDVVEVSLFFILQQLAGVPRREWLGQNAARVAVRVCMGANAIYSFQHCLGRNPASHDAGNRTQPRPG
jgi:hypothetical protein